MSKFKTKDKKGKGEFNSILWKETAQNARGDVQWGDIVFEIASLSVCNCFQMKFPTFI